MKSIIQSAYALNHSYAYCAGSPMKGKLMKLLKDILRGVLIGISNIIPGVSGGTMAVSMGIYDTIISSITNLFKDFKKSILTLLPYLIGMLLGIGGLSFAIEYFFGHFPLQTGLLFIGLILGGLPSITKRLKGKGLSITNVVLFLIFFAAIILLQLFSGERVTELTTSFQLVQTLKLFVVGMVASATMVIPGVSGSLILMLLGFYTPVVETISTFIKGLLAFDQAAILGGIVILIPFGIGVVVGMFAIAKLIEFLLAKFEAPTYSSILGLVIASPVVVFMTLEGITFSVFSILTGIIALAIGFFIALKLGNE